MLQNTETHDSGLRHVSYRVEPKDGPYPPSWSNTLPQSHPGMALKGEAGKPYDIPFSVGMKGEPIEAGLNEFHPGNGSMTSEQWGKFSQRETLIPGYSSGFHPLQKAPSPATSESTTPPSLSSSLQSSSHESLAAYYPGQSQELRLSNSHGCPDQFSRQSITRGGEPWAREYDGFGARKLNSGSFPNFGLGANSGLGLANTLPPIASHLGNGSNFSQGLHGQMNAGFAGSGHISPQPAASTSSGSSGSSSPSLRGELYDRNNWKYTVNAPPSYGALLPSHSNARPMDWQATCDPRAICHERHNMHGMLPMHPPHVHSQDDSDGSDNNPNFGDGSKRVKIRPRPYDWGHLHGQAKTMLIGNNVNLEMMYRANAGINIGGVGVKKKEEMLGMGLEDINEADLQFTSRQDTKPTRLLRRQCYNCKTWRDVSAWRRSIIEVGHIVCNKCGLYEKAHKRSRPLNDRGEFVRPGKHLTAKPLVSRPISKPRLMGNPTGGEEVILRFDTKLDENEQRSATIVKGEM